MKCFAVLLFAVAVFVQPALGLAEDEGCLIDALRNYTALRTAALMEANPILSPEAAVGLRRMEEAYCYRVAYCIIGDPKAESSRQIPYAAEFTTCLRDEALEQYGKK